MVMSKLSKKDVLHVAKLASLKLKGNEVKKFKKELSEVVSFVDRLKSVDTKGLSPTNQTTGLENITRKDEVVIDDCLTKDDVLSGAKRVHNDYFVVPAVLEKESSNK